MDATALRNHICESFEGVAMMENAGDSFFAYDPDGDLPAQRWFPFATIVTDDNYDTASRLHRPDTYRINIGLSKTDYTARFGKAPTERDENGMFVTEFDYTALDLLMPHPVYGGQHWVCALNPADASLREVHGLLDAAYRFAARKHANRKADPAAS
ncbi:DUF6194 family protein [Actinoalloteichus hymeniacidonis]|uniref:DUF6194 domain-containing protein n=1 Tax=Actinoalloteichus hymeniacidonis TaxID=340345 RepID=A0AAC9MY48_9PSEU|nr:DUF6194 family protein [Actinoalloteichus hymeniacidonis]AOS64048.1 hypothetical protein TL08_16240 [Actinoalloteichus hymeniacidonis]MBB5907890.1 hypothetical protein [Actinoalloteichus hymeniacidonis]